MNHTTCANTTRRRPTFILVLAAMACAGLVLLCSPVTAKPRARGSASSSNLLHRQRDVAAKRGRLRATLRAKRAQEHVARGRLHDIYVQLQRKSKALAATADRLHATRREFRQADDRLHDATARLNGHRKALSARLVAFYERGAVQFVDVLARANSFSDFANRMYVAQAVVNQDLGLMHAMDDAQRRVRRYRNQVQAKERAVGQLTQRYAVERDQVASLSLEQAREVRAIAAQRARLERELAQCDREERSIAAMLRRIQRSPSGRKRWARRWTGHFMRPVNGAITSPFGPRNHPIYHVWIDHKGVDLRAPMGAPIHAADAGVVVKSTYEPGYGQHIVIDHGGGVATLYGHCSKRIAHVGQQVRKGQIIGYVGSTGASTGPHLHFGARINGAWVNPLAH